MIISKVIKIIYFIILSFFLSSAAYTENSAYPEEGKTYKCTHSKYANNVREFTFRKVKKGQSNLAPNDPLVLYLVQRKATESDKEVQTLHYALSVNGPTFLFTIEPVDNEKHSFWVELFDNNAGQYFEQGLWIDKSTFDQIIIHYNRLGHDISSLDKLKKAMKKMQLIKLTDKNFKKELNSLKELYNFLIDINSSGKMQTFMRYQAAFNCN
tara:strand:+ start:3660 stop:4292 length:633 start_codon:yes stop_codon:yes gene_type:complete